MSKCIWLASAACAVALASAALIGCGAGQRSPSAVTPSRSSAHGGSKLDASIVVEDSALQHAREFFVALRSGDVKSLHRVSCPHFEYRTTAKVNKCPHRVDTSEAFDQLITCVRADPMLRDELADADNLASNAVQIRELPNWTAPLMDRELGPSTAVSSFINGDGVTYSFVLLWKGICIERLMLTASFETG
jgi:hypothetical protein